MTAVGVVRRLQSDCCGSDSEEGNPHDSERSRVFVVGSTGIRPMAMSHLFYRPMGVSVSL